MAPHEIVLVAGSRSAGLAKSVGRALQLKLWPVRNELFPDGERHVHYEATVRRMDVFILQSTPAPTGESVLELLLLADAAHRAGASRVTALIPYFGYARQDRRKLEGEPVGLAVVTEMLRQARLDRIVTVDLHSPSTEGCFSCPVEHLSALPLLVSAAGPQLSKDSVVVSPDLGAARLARECGKRLGLPVALVHKTRVSGREVAVEEVAGEVTGRLPFVIDDMISTGGTIAAALGALSSQGAKPGAVVAATHGILTAGSGEVLRSCGITTLLATDSVDPSEDPGAILQRVPLAPLLSDAILRLHDGRPLGELLSSR